MGKVALELFGKEANVFMESCDQFTSHLRIEPWTLDGKFIDLQHGAVHLVQTNLPPPATQDRRNAALIKQAANPAGTKLSIGIDAAKVCAPSQRQVQKLEHSIV